MRLKEFDYSNPGYYFITTCTRFSKNLFGKIARGKMELNKYGLIVEGAWLSLPDYYSNIELDYYSIMPNHFHAILILTGRVEMNFPSPEIKTEKFTLSQIIAYFKYQTTKKINELSDSAGEKIWQRSFYDRIIRNEKELYLIRKYIEQNPFKWALENNLPDNLDI